MGFPAQCHSHQRFCSFKDTNGLRLQFPFRRVSAWDGNFSSLEFGFFESFVLPEGCPLPTACAGLLISPALLLSPPAPRFWWPYPRTFSKSTHSFFQMCLQWNQIEILELGRQKCFFDVHHGDICSDAGPQACVYGPDRTARFLLDCVFGQSTQLFTHRASEHPRWCLGEAPSKRVHSLTFQL